MVAHNKNLNPAKSNSEFLVAPSILSADFSKLAEEIKSVQEAGANWLHVDVMDGHFVPNLTIGAPVVKSIKPVTSIPMDVHLMIEAPEKLVDDFCKAGADYLTIHVESTKSPKEVISQIRSHGVCPGITLRPETPIEEVFPFLELVDLVLVMTVSPGFGGQKFMNEQVEKISVLRKKINEMKLKVLIEVDGGINHETAALCKEADVLVAGSYIFGANKSTTKSATQDTSEKIKSYTQAILSLKGAKAR